MIEALMMQQSSSSSSSSSTSSSSSSSSSSNREEEIVWCGANIKEAIIEQARRTKIFKARIDNELRKLWKKKQDMDFHREKAVEFAKFATYLTECQEAVKERKQAVIDNNEDVKQFEEWFTKDREMEKLVNDFKTHPWVTWLKEYVIASWQHLIHLILYVILILRPTKNYQNYTLKSWM
jgi:hypothetical protein